MSEIEHQIWLGSFFRAIHRYATAAAIVATCIHVLQLLAQGKSWGPRLMAWISGVVLLLFIYLSAWTGYVMVWDQGAQVLAVAGAEMLRIIPFLKDTIGHAFNGSTEVNTGFFFMNLFLHVAIPVGMIFGLWIHTSRLARTVWFPIRPIFLSSTIGLSLLAAFWSAPLLPEADLLQIIGRIPLDWFTAFWLPILAISPSLALAGGLVATLFLLSIPYWWRPVKTQTREVSKVDEANCTGCMQCALDCPYAAITMIPREDGRKRVAIVNPDWCVSCGICTASCADYAVGPIGRRPEDQLQWSEQLLSRLKESGKDGAIIAVTCVSNGSLYEKLAELANHCSDIQPAAVDCCGAIHSDTIKALLGRADGVYLVGCPARNCRNRDGLTLISERIFEKRVPFLAKDLDRRRVKLATHSDVETGAITAELLQFRAELRGEDSASTNSLLTSLPKYFVRTIVGAMLLLVIAALSQIPFGEVPQYAIFRMEIKLPPVVKVGCRKPTADELASLPFHMRKKEICEQHKLNYSYTLSIDNAILASRTDIHAASIGGDRPIFIDEEIKLPAGEHAIELVIHSATAAALQPEKIYRYDISSTVGRAVLLVIEEQSEPRIVM